MDRSSFAKQLLILAFSIALLGAPGLASAQTASDPELAGIFSSLYSVLESLARTLQALGPAPVQAQTLIKYVDFENGSCTSWLFGCIR